MAEIIPASGKGHKSGTRARRLSTKVDLTPMVDLGFLLITFFIFTTTASEAKAMNLHLPQDSPDSLEAPAGKTLSFVLGADNKAWCYQGDSKSGAVSTGFSDTGIRQIIQVKRKELLQKFKTADDMIVLIKPTSESSYRNVVDILDEMTISNVTRYVLMEPDEQDNLLARKH